MSGKITFCFAKMQILLLFIPIAVATGKRFSHGVVFPGANDYRTQCNLTDDGQLGLCKSLKNCPTALVGPEEPKTCYFKRFEQFVCCKSSAADFFDRTKESPAIRACNIHYPDIQYITGGVKAKPHEFPYMCALGWETWEENVFEYKCGGTLFEDNFIITAAHCVNQNGASPVVVLPGGPDLTETAKTFKIARIIVHPEYKSNEAYHDIAIIQTEEGIPQTKACLYSQNNLLENNVTIIGYGTTQFAGPSSIQLLKADVSAISNDECAKYYEEDGQVPHGIMAQQMCANDPENLRDTCQGDSGGPLLMHHHLKAWIRPYIVGITSFGRGCAGGAPGVYTKIYEYLEWIESVVWPN